MPERNEIPAATPPRNELPSLNFSGDYPDAFGTADDLADQPGWDEAEEGTSVDDAALYADAAAAAEAEKERLAYEARQAEAAAERERLEQQAALEELGASGSAGGPSPLETKPPSKAPGTLASDAKPGDKSTPQAGEWPDGKPLGQEAADTLSDTVVTPPAGGTTDTAPVAPPHTPLIPGMANAPPALPGGGKTTFERLKERYERQQKERGVVDRISDSVADYFKESQRQEEYKREILRKAAYDELSDEERMKHARLLDGIEDDYTLEAIGANFIPLPLGNLGRAATIEAREAGIAAKTAATDLLEQAGRGGGTAAKEALEAGAARARKQAAEAAAKKREDMLKPLADRKPVDNVGVQNAEIDRIHKEFIETGYWPKDKTLGGSYAAPMPDEILMKARQEFLKANPSKSGQ